MGLPPLERQWAVLRTISARRYGATVRELAEEHTVSLKTIRRDLESLRRAGIRLNEREEAHGRKRWIAEIEAGAPPLSFDVSEILALYLARTLLEPLAGTVFWEATSGAFRKIRTTLGEPALEYLDQLTGLIFRTSFRDSNYREKSRLIDDLMVAIEDRRITFITYQSARSTEPLTYDVYPYGLVYHRGSLYLVAHSQQHAAIRNFKVDRISGVALQQYQTPIPPAEPGTAQQQQPRRTRPTQQPGKKHDRTRSVDRHIQSGDRTLDSSPTEQRGSSTASASKRP